MNYSIFSATPHIFIKSVFCFYPLYFSILCPSDGQLRDCTTFVLYYWPQQSIMWFSFYFPLDLIYYWVMIKHSFIVLKNSTSSFGHLDLTAYCGCLHNDQLLQLEDLFPSSRGGKRDTCSPSSSSSSSSFFTEDLSRCNLSFFTSSLFFFRCKLRRATVLSSNT